MDKLYDAVYPNVIVNQLGCVTGDNSQLVMLALLVIISRGLSGGPITNLMLYFYICHLLISNKLERSNETASDWFLLWKLSKGH